MWPPSYTTGAFVRLIGVSFHYAQNCLSKPSVIWFLGALDYGGHPEDYVRGPLEGCFVGGAGGESLQRLTPSVGTSAGIRPPLSHHVIKRPLGHAHLWKLEYSPNTPGILSFMKKTLTRLPDGVLRVCHVVCELLVPLFPPSV